jgi:hypothetical protein
MFINPDHMRIAATQSNMFVLSEDGLDVEEVPAPASERERGHSRWIQRGCVVVVRWLWL